MKFIVISSIVFGLLYFWPISTFVLEDFQKDEITVYVKGEVIEEKKITIKKFSTIEDVLSLVQLTEQADISMLNELMYVKDQDVIIIPQIKEFERVSINTATLEELMSIPGIGKIKAEKIIMYREQYGYFQVIEDLMNIDGIKQKTFDKLKDYICL